MEIERYLTGIFGTNRLSAEQIDYTVEIMQNLSLARESLSKFDYLKDPLQSIYKFVFLLPHEPNTDIGFTIICNICVCIEEAEKNGLTSEEILEVMDIASQDKERKGLIQ